MSAAGAAEMASTGWDVEARRQQALLDAVSAPTAKTMLSHAAAARVAQRGMNRVERLEAYRDNAAAVAARALGAVFPTIEAMLGVDDFARLAHEHWRAQPPALGDLGEWGAGFAEMLEHDARLAAYPYLADCARLDVAVHRCERAADATFEPGSLTLLGSGDPYRLRLHLTPGTAVLRSPWPIVTIQRAHRHAEPGLEAARVAIAERRDECALVVRCGWHASVQAIDAATAMWTEQLLAGTAVGAALDSIGEGFDFAAWLARALEGSWLHRATESTS